MPPSSLPSSSTSSARQNEQGTSMILLRKIRFEGRIYNAKLFLTNESSSSSSSIKQFQLPCGIIVDCDTFPLSMEKDVLLLMDNNSDDDNDRDNNDGAYSSSSSSCHSLHDISAKWVRHVLCLMNHYSNKEEDNNNNNTSAADDDASSYQHQRQKQLEHFSEINKLQVISEEEEEEEEEYENDDNSKQRRRRRSSSHVVIECYSVKHESALGRPILTMFGKFQFHPKEKQENADPTSSSPSSLFLREAKAYEVLMHLGLDTKNIIAPVCFSSCANLLLHDHHPHPHHDDSNMNTTSSSHQGTTNYILLQELPVTFTRFDPRNTTVVMDPRTGETLQVAPDVRPELKRVAVSLAALHVSSLSSSRLAIVEQSLCSDQIFFENWRRSLQPYGEEFLLKTLLSTSSSSSSSSSSSESSESSPSLFKQEIASQILRRKPTGNTSAKTMTTCFIHGSLHDPRHILLDRENHRSPAILVDWKRCGVGYREIDLLHVCACLLHPKMRKEHNMVEYFLDEYLENCTLMSSNSTTEVDENDDSKKNTSTNSISRDELMDRMALIAKIMTMTKSNSLCDWVPDERVRFELLQLLNEWGKLE